MSRYQITVTRPHEVEAHQTRLAPTYDEASRIAIALFADYPSDRVMIDDLTGVDPGEYLARDGQTMQVQYVPNNSKNPFDTVVRSAVRHAQ